MGNIRSRDVFKPIARECIAVVESYKAKYVINKAIFLIFSPRYMQDKQPVSKRRYLQIKE